MLARGESMASMQSYEPLSSDAAVLIMLFLVLAALFSVGLFVSLLLIASQLDFENLSTVYFWEPKLAAHFTPSDLGFSENQRNDEPYSVQFYNALDNIWSLLFTSLLGGELKKHKHWGVTGKVASRAPAWPLSLVAIVVLPVWLLIGFFSMGLLWPPQIREAFFRPSRLGQRSKSSLDLTASEVSKMRSELFHLKSMAYYRSDETAAKVHDIADVLHSFMKEE